MTLEQTEKGQLAFNAGRYCEAADVWLAPGSLDITVASDPHWARVALALRRAQRGTDVAELRAALSVRGVPNVHVHLQHALVLHERGDTSVAVETLSEVSARYGARDRVEIGRICVQMLAERASFNEAKVAAHALRELDPVYGERIFRFCLAYIERKIHSYAISNSRNTIKLDAYWADRSNSVYIHVVRQLIDVIARSANRVADIGSNGTPILDFYPDACEKYSVDSGTPYEGTGVTAVRARFQDWTPPGPIEVATCLQVIEHVPDAAGFAKRLLKFSEVCLVSVPYKERAGANPGHVQSNIDEGTIRDWFGRPPNYSYVARELDGGERIICVFDTKNTERWQALCGHCEAGLRFRYRWSYRNAPEALGPFM